ncbi:group II intron maturase-specific domain-containing protein [Spongiactinospora sp. 9N601]|uniref:group II intron maturase-specific domain-containing protein n=1 Tax=Spongiactinospora sp. 9N601 TaxID=3375149 RepID=UPI0037B188C2
MAPQARHEHLARLHLHRQGPDPAAEGEVRALTRKTSPLNLDALLAQLNRVMGGWAFYFQHAIAKRVFANLDAFTWWRLARLLRQRHRWSWKEFRRRHTTPTGRWLPFSANGVTWRHREDPGHPVSLSRRAYPQPMGSTSPLNGSIRGEPATRRRVRRVRKAIRRNGPVARPAPRSGPTLRAP